MPAVEKFIPFIFTNAAKGKAEISIRGTIGVPKAYAEYMSSGAGGTVSDFEKELKNIGSDVDEVTMRIFSRGGDIFTAMAMHDMIAAHPARFVAVVDGLAASAATWLMNACDEIQMPANAWYFMHNVQSLAIGDHRTLNKAASESEKFTNDLARVYQGRMKTAGKKTSLNTVRKMMDDETWLNGSEAKDQGLVDKVIGEVALSACIGAPVFNGDLPPVNLDRVPAELRVLFDTQPNPNPDNQTPPNSTADTMKPEEIQTLITNAIKAQADETTKAIQGIRDGFKNEITTALTPALETALKPLNEKLGALENAVKPVEDLSTRLKLIEDQRKAGIDPSNIGGGKAAEGAAGEGEDKTKDEQINALRKQLDNCHDSRERGKIASQISKLRAA